jgi:hypothetical protein
MHRRLLNILRFSVEWTALGNELSAGHVSFRRFHDWFSQRLPFLGHVKINAVNVVNHLGDVIPVPDVFCSTWKVPMISFLDQSQLTSLRIFIMLSTHIANIASAVTLSTAATTM